MEPYTALNAYWRFNIYRDRFMDMIVHTHRNVKNVEKEPTLEDIIVHLAHIRRNAKNAEKEMKIFDTK